MRLEVSGAPATPIAATAIENTEIISTGQFLTGMIDALDTPLCVLDSNATIIASNHAWARLCDENGPWPVRREQASNYLDLWRAMRGDCQIFAQRLLLALEDILAGKRTRYVDLYLLPGQADGYQINVSAFTVGVPAYVVTHTKVTPPPLDDEHNRAHVARLALIAKYTHNRVVITDANRCIEWVNEGFERQTGYCLSEVIGKTPGEVLYGPDTDPEVVATLRESIANAKEITAEIVTYNKDGARNWALVEIRPIFDPDGTLTNFISVAADVTELKQRAYEIHDREVFFRAITENALDPIITIDQESKITLFNLAAETLFGYDREEILGQSIDLLLRADIAKERQQDRERLLTTGRSSAIGYRGVDIICVTKDGTEKQIRLTASRFILSNGQMCFAGIFHDLTEQRKLEADLAHAQKLEAVGQLSAGIAHEINTPIQYLSSNIEFLQQAFADLTLALDQLCSLGTDTSITDPAILTHKIDELREEADIEFLIGEIPGVIQKCLGGITRVSNIVSSMKEFAQVGQTREPADLNQAIETTVSISRNEWHDTADVTTKLDPELPLVDCIVSDIKQVVLLMLINATHAIRAKLGDDSQEKGVIEIRTEKQDEYAIITIKDTGTGMSAEVESKIFDPFFTTKAVGSGTGQGLTMARRLIVEKHQGKIEVNSEERHGAEFRVLLPLK